MAKSKEGSLNERGRGSEGGVREGGGRLWEKSFGRERVVGEGGREWWRVW